MVNYESLDILKRTIGRISDKLYQLAQDGNIILLFQTYGIQLKETGVDYTGLCPQHPEKTPSFRVARFKKVCKCYSCWTWRETRRMVFNLEFWERTKRRMKRLLQLEQKIDTFLGREKISQYDKKRIKNEYGMRKREDQILNKVQPKHLEQPKTETDEEYDLPF